MSDQVALTVEQDLKDGIPLFENVFAQQGWTSASSRDMINGVFRGEQTRISGKAALRVVVLDKSVEWHATRVRDDTYNFYIDCLAKVGAKREEIERFINVFGSVVHNYLNRFSNLQPVIDGTSLPIRAYNSWAPKMTKGYAQGGAYRVARIDYWIKVLNPYVARPNLVGDDC